MPCAYCGVALVPGLAWCGRCMQPVRPPDPPPPPPVAEPVLPAYAPPPAYAVAVPAAATPLPAPAPPPLLDGSMEPDPPAVFTAGAARAMLAGGTRVPEWTPPPPGLFPEPEPAPKPDPKPRSAGLATFVAIAVGALGQGVFHLVTRGTVENEAMVRYALVTTLGVYLVVALIVLRRVAADEHPLRWRGSWPVWVSVLFGAAFGGGLAAGLVALAGGGGDGGDSSLAILVSEADAPHIAATVLIACVAAPFLEEILFRGLLLASSLGRGTRFAVWVSSAAFSVWHLDPAHFKYYVLMGLVFAALYLRRGLACSIAAHAAFNGVLVAVAVAYALAPGPVVTDGALTLQAPRGWHTHPVEAGALVGPSGAEVLVIESPRGMTGSADRLWEQFAEGEVPGLGDVVTARGETAHTVELPAGTAARVRVVLDGRDGELVMIPARDRVYLVLLVSGGSPRVRADFDRMLHDIRLG